MPYGTKSLSTVERYAIENARFLEAHGIKLLVVACNTASALALPSIRATVKVPVVGVIEPGARAAVEVAAGKTIGVIATEATVQSGAYANAIGKIDPAIEVIERACPLFVPLAEEGWAETDVARAVAEQYLSDLKKKDVGALVLGCTHYPILRNLISGVVGNRRTADRFWRCGRARSRSDFWNPASFLSAKSFSREHDVDGNVNCVTTWIIFM